MEALKEMNGMGAVISFMLFFVFAVFVGTDPKDRINDITGAMLLLLIAIVIYCVIEEMPR